LVEHATANACHVRVRFDLLIQMMAERSRHHWIALRIMVTCNHLSRMSNAEALHPHSATPWEQAKIATQENVLWMLAAAVHAQQIGRNGFQSRQGCRNQGSIMIRMALLLLLLLLLVIVVGE
jgi:hypothetical protein